MDFIPETQLGQLMPIKLETVGSRQVPKCFSELDSIKKKEFVACCKCLEARYFNHLMRQANEIRRGDKLMHNLPFIEWLLQYFSLFPAKWALISCITHLRPPSLSSEINSPPICDHNSRCCGGAGSVWEGCGCDLGGLWHKWNGGVAFGLLVLFWETTRF